MIKRSGDSFKNFSMVFSVHEFHKQDAVDCIAAYV